MKKKYSAIITILILIIIAMGVGFFVYVHNNTATDNTEKNNTQAVSSTANSENETEKNINDFKGYSAVEWGNMIKRFYSDFYKTTLTDVTCKYDQYNQYTATLKTKYEVCAEFVFDDVTGYATEKGSKVIIDFINGKFVDKREYTKDLFSDNICLLIGSVTPQNSKEFISKYFESEQVYNSLFTFDFRHDVSTESQYKDEFVIIPENENVEISIYDCKINENGEIEKNNSLAVDISEPFILIADSLEPTTPAYCIELKCNGFEDTIPLLFSGEDGKLVLTGHECEVLDISIY